MSQLERLPENEPRRILKEAQANDAELKSFQRLGSSSVLTARVFSPDIYDVELASPDWKIHRVDVEFIPDDMTFGGALGLRLEVAPLTSDNTPTREMLTVERRPVVNGRQVWSVYYVSWGGAAFTRRLKFYIFALGSGTFTTNVVN